MNTGNPFYQKPRISSRFFFQVYYHAGSYKLEAKLSLLLKEKQEIGSSREPIIDLWHCESLCIFSVLHVVYVVDSTQSHMKREGKHLER